MKNLLLLVLLTLLSGCALSTEGASPERAAEPDASAECVSHPWSLDDDGLDWCEGRRYPQTVFVGCAEPPHDACAPAERSDRSDAWCC